MAAEKTLVAVFVNTRVAEEAVERLMRAGIPERVLQIVKPEEDAAGDSDQARKIHTLLIARVPEAAAADLGQALTELGATSVDDGQHTGVRATDVNFEPFSEGVFELPEFTEETIAVKRAWVIEEIVLANVVRERTEAVHHTLQRRDVSVERRP